MRTILEIGDTLPNSRAQGIGRLLTEDRDLSRLSSPRTVLLFSPLAR